eukprot:354411-Chlamydomonas_euryale.AAC.21
MAGCLGARPHLPAKAVGQDENAGPVGPQVATLSDGGSADEIVGLAKRRRCWSSTTESTLRKGLWAAGTMRGSCVS